MKELKQYYQQVYNALPCYPKQKKHLLHQLKPSVGGYLQEHPDADLAAIEQHFGTPEQIVASCLEEMEAPQVLQKIKVNHRIVKIIVAIAACIVLLWGIAVGIALINEFDSYDGCNTVIIDSNQ